MATGTFYDLSSATTRLLESQSVADLASLGLAGKNELVQACGALLTYLEQTQKGAFGHLGEFKPLNLGKAPAPGRDNRTEPRNFRRLDGKAGARDPVAGAWTGP